MWEARLPVTCSFGLVSTSCPWFCLQALKGEGPPPPTLGLLLQAQAAQEGPVRAAFHHRLASGVAGDGWSLGASKPPRG